MPVSALRRPVELSRQPATARRELAQILDDTHWPGDTDGAVLAVHEAMVNSQRHGGGVTRATAGFDGPALVVQISDRGRGLFLIRHLASDAHVERAGGDVHLMLTFAP